MKKFLRRIGILTGLTLLVLSLLDQLGRRPEDRTWYGSILGVPYDFRWPDEHVLRARWWNPRDERIFTPHVFGIGWSINLYQVKRRLQLLIA
jgi:hypothetical protein